MTFSRLWVLHFLWFLPFTVLLLILYTRQRKKALERFADPDLLSRLAGKDLGGRRFIKAFLLLLAMTMMLFALAGPRWGSHYQEVRQRGVDIMLLMDVSPSMLVEDVDPNRLERSRREILDLLRVLQGDRIGLVAFSGAAFIQCPLTLDYAALNLFLDSLHPDLIPVPGTDLGSAVETGLSAFDFESETDKVMILITDGEDNERRGLNAAKKAMADDVRIFVYGVGDTSGGPIPKSDGKGGFRKDKQGNLIVSKLNETTLKDMASLTGGNYVRSVAGDLDLDLLYFEGIKTKTKDELLKSGKTKVFEERFTFFLIPAFLLLALEGIVQDRKTVER